MKYYQTLLPTLLLPMLFLAGCSSDSKTTQSSTQYESSSKKGKNKMPTQSPMLNEIFTSIGNRIIPPGQIKDVSDIVSKYIPIGTSKDEVKYTLEKMNQTYQDEGSLIRAGYGIETHPMIPSPRVQITLQFNQHDFLENIKADLSHAQ